MCVKYSEKINPCLNWYTGTYILQKIVIIVHVLLHVHFAGYMINCFVRVDESLTFFFNLLTMNTESRQVKSLSNILK